jgi:mannosyltransferase
MPLVVHPHFHARYTGVTRHIEGLVPALGGVRGGGSEGGPQGWEARTAGQALAPGLPRIGLLELLRRARREPLVWHAHRINELLAGQALRLVGRDVRLVFTRHTSKRPSPLTRLLARGAHARVALTREVEEALALPAEVVGHGVDLGQFRPPEDRAAAWARLGVGRRRGLGVVGRVRPEKGQGDFLAALGGGLLRAHPDWQAVLVGMAKGPDRAWVDGLLGGLDLGEQLALVGEQRQVEAWYQGLSVLVHPSFLEGYSLVHVEAMASGCCVVASHLPYLSGLIEHGRTGFLYPPGDVAALRELLAMLLREPERAEAVGRAAAEHARGHCGVEHEARALAALYARVLEGGRGGALGPGAGGPRP